MLKYLSCVLLLTSLAVVAWAAVWFRPMFVAFHTAFNDQWDSLARSPPLQRLPFKIPRCSINHNAGIAAQGRGDGKITSIEKEVVLARKRRKSATPMMFNLNVSLGLLCQRSLGNALKAFFRLPRISRS